jgi:hypothetical protein
LRVLKKYLNKLMIFDEFFGVFLNTYLVLQFKLPS